MIREAKLEDMEAVVRMGLRFAEETHYGGIIKTDPVWITKTAADLMGRESSAVLVSENGHGPNGIIAVLMYQHPFSGEKTAFEVFWWSDPEAVGTGIRLVKAAEKWAQERGATAMQMIAPEGSDVGLLYRRMQYAPVERSYQRRF